MPTAQRASLDEVRGFYAQLMTAASGSGDPRLARAFESVRREAFMGPGPWQIMFDGKYFRTPSADPIYLYQNALVALDAEKGINNGAPFLHAAWIGAVEPQAGETVCHIGAGTGYYTAILSLLVLQGGIVHAIEMEPHLAERSRTNLQPFKNVIVVAGDATALPLPNADLIYVNAGVTAPPRTWLQTLKIGGRMIFPWRPADDIGITLLITRSEVGFAVEPRMASWFISCVGASGREGCAKAPSNRDAWSVRSIRLGAEREPDQTAVAIYKDVWFSSAAL
jgi:protein-L-isoaspartate(D-aspartate) O-methyltransferase